MTDGKVRCAVLGILILLAAMSLGSGIALAQFRPDDSAVRPPDLVPPAPFLTEAEGEGGERLYTRQEVIDLIDQRMAGYVNRAQDPPPAPTGSDAASANGLNPSMVARGEGLFNSACIDCHDAERSLQKRKTYAGWLATVRRMAGKDDADIPQSYIDPIAQYLTSVRGVATGGDGAAGAAAAEATGPSLNATISTLWRGGDDELPLEKPDFFVDAWVGASWQGSGAMSAAVTACTSCHSDRNPSAGFTLELVEASAKLDLTKLCCGQETACIGGVELSCEIQAGRFIVPFGAFSAMSHPGVYRTATNPLMFNMGRRVGPLAPLQPVLPAPFSDEGVNLSLTGRMFDDLTVTVDAFAINGLQQDGPRIFNGSRRYYDNNREPFTGGRITVGNSTFRLGGSLMTGHLQDEGLTPLGSKLSGADATLRFGDLLRFYFEYAIRTDDSPILAGGENHVYGTVFEAEVKVWDHPDVGLLARYDTLEHRDTLFGESSIDRFTWGINMVLPGGSNLILNHEHWMLDPTDYDVLAARWVAAF